MRRAFILAAESQLAQRLRLVVGDVEHEAQHRGRKHLALRVGLERQRSAAVERAVQQEVERVEIRKLEPLDVAGDDAAKMLAHAIERDDTAASTGYHSRLERDDADVRRVALVARARVRDVEEADLHESTSTCVCTTVLSMSAGQ